VVDDVTGDPLEGVIIVAQWELVHEVIPMLVNQRNGDTLKIIEVVSDKEGKYFIPGWGPLLRPLFFHLEERDPSIVFFKSEYYPQGTSNEIRSQYSRNSVRTSQINGETIRLRKFTGQPQQYVVRQGRLSYTLEKKGTLEEYASDVRNLQINLNWDKENGDWRNYPRMILALGQERERLKAAGLAIVRIQRPSSLYGGKEVVDQFLKEYEN